MHGHRTISRCILLVLVAHSHPDRQNRPTGPPARAPAIGCIMAAAVPIAELHAGAKRPRAGVLGAALIVLHEDKALLAATLRDGCVFRGTEEDMPLFEKLKGLCPGYAWSPMVAACTKTLVQLNKHCGCKISGNTAKKAGPEFYRSDATRIATLWAKAVKPSYNAHHYRVVLALQPWGSSSGDSQPLDAGAPARKKLKSPIFGRRRIVMRATGTPVAVTTAQTNCHACHWYTGGRDNGWVGRAARAFLTRERTG